MAVNALSQTHSNLGGVSVSQRSILHYPKRYAFAAPDCPVMHFVSSIQTPNPQSGPEIEVQRFRTYRRHRDRTSLRYIHHDPGLTWLTCELLINAAVGD